MSVKLRITRNLGREWPNKHMEGEIVEEDDKVAAELLKRSLAEPVEEYQKRLEESRHAKAALAPPDVKARETGGISGREQPAALSAPKQDAAKK